MSRVQKKVLKRGMMGAAGYAEAAVAGGVLVAEHDDADGDQDEGEEGADVGTFRRRSLRRIRLRGMATRMPANQVAKAGVRKRGWSLEKASGRRRSRDMANQTRAWPS